MYVFRMLPRQQLLESDLRKEGDLRGWVSQLELINHRRSKVTTHFQVLFCARRQTQGLVSFRTFLCVLFRLINRIGIIFSRT